MGVLAAYGQAVRILLSRPLLFGALVLAVGIPSHLLVYAILGSGDWDDTSGVRVARLLYALVDPISTGAVISALAEIQNGRRPFFWPCLKAGLSAWFPLFTARLAAALLVAVGFLALVVPGIVLFVRYALLDAVVVLEDAGPSEARKISAELGRGRRWRLFGAGMFYAGFAALNFLGGGFLSQSFEGLNALAPSLALDCAVNLFFSVFTAVFFLFYWEARGGSMLMA